jgi:hypothetical protein
MSTSLPLIMRSSWGFFHEPAVRVAHVASELAVRAAHAAGELLTAVAHLID